MSERLTVRQARRAYLHRRLASTTRLEDARDCCAIVGCGRPTAMKAGKGFSTTHCKYHNQFRNRHGSFWKGTITGPVLKPYHRAAERFIKAHAQDLYVSNALSKLAAMLDGAGAWRSAAEVKSRWLTPVEKARASLARLREAEVPPHRILATCLGVAGAIAEDPIGPGGEPGEYRRVQMAKAIFRKASGYHGAYDRYPRSSGRMLRALGHMLEETCGLAVEQHLAAVLAVKAGGAIPPLRVLKAELEPATATAWDDLARLFP